MISTNDKQSSSVIEETITCHERTPIGTKSVTGTRRSVATPRQSSLLQTSSCIASSLLGLNLSPPTQHTHNSALDFQSSQQATSAMVRSPYPFHQTPLPLPRPF